MDIVFAYPGFFLAAIDPFLLLGNHTFPTSVHMVWAKMNPPPGKNE